MKKQGSGSKFIGEERLRESSGLIKKLFEGVKKPSVVNSEAVKSAKKIVAKESAAFAGEIVSQFLGIELKAGKSVNIHQKAETTPHKEESSEKPRLTAEQLAYFADFKKKAEGGVVNETDKVIKNQLNAILSELRNLKNSSDELENVFKDVVIEQPPENPGVYHLTFFEGFLKLVLKMKDKVQDGVVYAKLFKSRKQEKSYSSMAKKGGTSYTLHHDRSVATQTG